MQPLLSDEIQAFKALILVHKVVKDGHPNVKKKAKKETRAKKTNIVYRLLKTLLEKRDG